MGKVAFLAVTLALLGWIAPYVAHARPTDGGTGRDPWVFLLVAPAQLLILVIVTAGVFVDGSARDRLPAFLREPLTLAPRPGWPTDQPLPGRALNILQSLYWLFFGAFFAFFGTTVQIAMTSTLILHPDRYSPMELVIVGVESLAAAAWIAFLAGAVLGARRGPSRENS